MPSRRPDRKRPTSHRAAAAAPASNTVWFFGAWLALVAVTLAAYHPVWHGGRLWDDNGHLTKAALQSLHGLWRIWFDVGATQQYYPVVHSAFWVMHRLWGDDTLGYHLVNITLHATSAFLLLLVLRRLSVPGAVLAAVIFALHPVQVESVAWMTELKNTLSGALYLSAALTYLAFDQDRRWSRYALASALFVLAVFSKTVTATLPAALLVIFWWQRGRLRLREDVLPLLPWLAIGIGGGVATAVLERTQIGAEGPAFQIAFLDRVVIAGHATWFYLWHLIWPANLMFVYPRWPAGQFPAWQAVFPIAVVLVGVTFLWLARRTRSPLAALLLFVGTLTPALGFVNVYPFVYSFVADHFQYLACTAVIAVAAAAAVALGKRAGLDVDAAPGRVSAAAAGLLAIVALALGMLTWRQSADYTDATTLYEATLARNPSCWLCENNLGMAMLTSIRGIGDPAGAAQSSPLPADQRQIVEASIVRFQDALRVKPDSVQAWNNLGSAELVLGRVNEARDAFQRAVQARPDDAEARSNFGLALWRLQQPVQAAAELRESIRLDATRAAPHATLAEVFLAANDLDGALTEFRESVRLNPTSADAHKALGAVLGRAGRVGEANTEYEAALALEPNDVSAHENLGVGLLRAGDAAGAAQHFQAAIAGDPSSVRAHYGLATAMETQGRHADALVEFQKTVSLDPGLAEAHNQLGVVLAESGRMREAIVEFREAVRLEPDSPSARANLAKALGGG